MNKYKAYNSILNSYDRHFDKDLLKQIVELGSIDSQTLKAKNLLEKAISELDVYFKKHENESLKKYKFEIQDDPEHESHLIRVEVTSTLKTKKFKISNHFIDSAEFSGLVNTAGAANIFSLISIVQFFRRSVMPYF